MKFETKTGSLYEIDCDQKLIRRLSGKVGPSSRQGADGEWKKYSHTFPIEPVVGSGIMIIWEDDQSISKNCFPATLTSVIVSISFM